MSEQLYLFATVSDTAVAISTDEIEAVVRLTEITPIYRVPCYVRGLAALRSRVLTVIDVSARATGVSKPLPPKPLAIVSEIGGHNFALLIDEVDDVCAVSNPVEPVLGRISDDWAPYARGMLLDDTQRLHLVVSLSDLTACPALGAAA